MFCDRTSGSKIVRKITASDVLQRFRLKLRGMINFERFRYAEALSPPNGNCAEPDSHLLDTVRQKDMSAQGTRCRKRRARASRARHLSPKRAAPPSAVPAVRNVRSPFVTSGRRLLAAGFSTGPV